MDVAAGRHERAEPRHAFLGVRLAGRGEQQNQRKTVRAEHGGEGWGIGRVPTNLGKPPVVRKAGGYLPVRTLPVDHRPQLA
jgi:hypothetical protein